MGHSRVTREDESLATKVEQARNATIVRAGVVLSRSTAEAFEAAVQGAIEEGPPVVMLDLGGVRVRCQRPPASASGSGIRSSAAPTTSSAETACGTAAATGSWSGERSATAS
jgi:hypothetical protein